MSTTPDSPAANRWPPQIKYIIGNEACERFSYYGMRSILAGYISGKVLAGGLGQSPDMATKMIHEFGSVNYFMPLLGAWVSDKLVGRYHIILWVSLFYCAGHGVLACSDLAGTTDGKMLLLYLGLTLIAFGSGGIKPCVSAFMGDQFKPEQSHLLQKAYGAFYWCINFGSFFAFLVIPWIRDKHGYSLAFAVPGILMALATIIFALGTPKYVRVPPTRKTGSAGFFQVVFTTLFTKPAGREFWDYAREKFSAKEADAAKSVLPILFVFALVPVFWALFNQTNTTWVLQGEKMVPYVLQLPLDLPTFTIGADEMQSANPAIVMILVPLLTLLVYPRLGRLASPLRRMSYGMFLAAAAYLVVAALQKQIEAGAHLSVLWQILPYLVLTLAEVLVSTTGLEFAFREAAPEMKSSIMSFWLMTVAVGDLLVVGVTQFFAHGADESSSVSTDRFLLYAGLIFVVAILFSLVATTYRYRDTAAGQGK